MKIVYKNSTNDNNNMFIVDNYDNHNKLRSTPSPDFPWFADGRQSDAWSS